jgi:hypothetical protein
MVEGLCPLQAQCGRRPLRYGYRNFTSSKRGTASWMTRCFTRLIFLDYPAAIRNVILIRLRRRRREVRVPPGAATMSGGRVWLARPGAGARG